MYKNKLSRNSLIFTAAILTIGISIFTVSCTKAKENDSSSNNIIEIKEKMFIAQVNDVYLNTEDYLGKTIKLEGIFMSEQYYEEAAPYYFVIRYGPGCCGTDANAGFEVKWEKDNVKSYPAADSWVEATGVLKIEEEGDYQYLYLALSSLDVLKKRGAEVVLQ
jgi:uncharacterized membrane protein YcgQ (UPF0703/DUF1980 family)